MILTLLKVKRVILKMLSYTPTFLDLTDGLDLPEAGISQSQDDSLTVEKVQRSPGDDRLQRLSIFACVKSI